MSDNNKIPASFDLLTPLDPHASTVTSQSPFYPNSDMYRDVFDNFPAGLAILSLEGEVLNVNPVFKYLTDYQPEAGSSFALVNSANDVVFDFEAMQPLLHYPGHAAYAQCDKNLGDAENSRWICLQVGLIRSAARKPLFFVIECRDIQSHKAELERMTHQIMHDPLTGLGNRKFLDYEFQRTLSLAKRHKTQFALIVIDVDKFKTLNDTLGHNVGDQILRHVATRLRKAVRLNDTVVRVGGDEFIIVLHEVKGREGAERVAQKLQSVFLEPVALEDQAPLTVTLSIGLSLSPQHGSDYLTLFNKADKALYQVKQRGRKGYQIYDEFLSNPS